MRHSLPNGDLAEILDRSVALLLASLERTRLAEVSQPRVARSMKTQSRHIPSAVRRAVWRRDQGMCAFEGAAGRCDERAFLEFHDVRPFEAGANPRLTTSNFAAARITNTRPTCSLASPSSSASTPLVTRSGPRFRRARIPDDAGDTRVRPKVYPAGFSRRESRRSKCGGRSRVV
jgi:hypothetical protein